MAAKEQNASVPEIIEHLQVVRYLWCEARVLAVEQYLAVTVPALRQQYRPT